MHVGEWLADPGAPAARRASERHRYLARSNAIHQTGRRLNPRIYLFHRSDNREQRRTILLVEHKMDVLRRLADRVVVLHQGALMADGAPAEIVASKIVQEAYLGIRNA